MNLRNAFLLAVAGCTLAACASPDQLGLSADQLETERYMLTERRRLPIDFAEVQKNLFQHTRLCGQEYVFQMLPNESSFARVVYRPQPDSGWDSSVVLRLTLLHNRSINVKAYSYYPGQMQRVHMMMTAMMKPESCEADTSWENKLGD